jgi:O-antigen ligase
MAVDHSTRAFAPPGPSIGVGSLALPSDSSSYARALLLVFLASAIDVRNALDRSAVGGPLRYLLLLVPISAAVLIRLRRPSTIVRAPLPNERVLMLLFAFGVTGTFIGVMFRGVTSTAWPLYLPMSIVFLSLLMVRPLTEREAGRLAVAIGAIAWVYIALGAVANSGLVESLVQYRQFKNASFPYVVMGLAAAVLLHRRGWTLVLSGLTVVIFLGYPSATSVLILLVTALTFIATGRRASRARPYLVAGIAVAIGLVALLNFSTSVDLLGRYFEFVGKRNTSEGRLEYWTSGLAEFRESPLIGTGFASDTVVEASRDRRSPYHNDFVMFLALGGIVGLVLLVAWIVLLERSLLRRYFGFARAGAHARARLARLLLVGLNGYIVSMFFNPVLQGLSRSATIFGLASIAALLGEPPRRPASASSTTSERIAQPGGAPRRATSA